MDYTKVKDKIRGVSITTATPFTDDLSSVDTDAISSNLEYISTNSSPVIIPCGNTGEFYSLNGNEWTQVVKTSVDSVGSSLAIVAGVGHSLNTAIDMIEQAENMGADGVMIMYPQHVFKSEEGILSYYWELLKAAKSIGVVLYKKGPLLSDAVLEKLMVFENLVAVKYAFGRIVDFASTISKLGDSVVWSCGTAERFTPFFWLAGATAFTSGLGNFAPKVTMAMYDALVSNDYVEAMRIQRMISPLEDLRETREAANNVPVVKAVLDHVGLRGGKCRPPIHPLSDVERQAAIEAVSEWDL
ncbi:MAG: dihydrodipicolinate synthase family protein [Candidatus Thorarchaeota archaeon]